MECIGLQSKLPSCHCHDCLCRSILITCWYYNFDELIFHYTGRVLDAINYHITSTGGALVTPKVAVFILFSL